MLGWAQGQVNVGAWARVYGTKQTFCHTQPKTNRIVGDGPVSARAPVAVARETSTEFNAVIF
jgi:hypothetical protein